ncbi:MAG TPA: PIG-L family deacetylase [Anaerolineales bacterium]|nr:PIG-L family deacetylase [Anaerolineales bacterium]
MRFHLPTAETFVPDGLPLEAALARTTHLAVSAHQDDLEIMAAGAILECFQRPDRWFTGIVVTDGRGSPRDGPYQDYSDEAMRGVRFKEQWKAAFVGEYAAQVILDYPSAVVKDGQRREPVDDLAGLVKAARPGWVLTHNPADKHDTHVAVALRVIAALRSLPETERPEKLFGCEVWRDLDWMIEADKAAFDLTAHENLQAALLGVHDSQISGGKRYDLATMGRRRANATYFESHGVDTAKGLAYAMDLTPLIRDTTLDIAAFVLAHIDRFAEDVRGRMARLG